MGAVVGAGVGTVVGAGVGAAVGTGVGAAVGKGVGEGVVGTVATSTSASGHSSKQRAGQFALAKFPTIRFTQANLPSIKPSALQSGFKSRQFSTLPLPLSPSVSLLGLQTSRDEQCNNATDTRPEAAIDASFGTARLDCVWASNAMHAASKRHSENSATQ
jgi:hypothetical protein